jgi:hypothetical protein
MRQQTVKRLSWAGCWPDHFPGQQGDTEIIPA